MNSRNLSAVRRWLPAVSFLPFAIACSSSGGDDSGSGGASPSGGVPSGGASTSGGLSTGGALSSGGASTAGAATAAGASGGPATAAGSSSGGAASGGAAGGPARSGGTAGGVASGGSPAGGTVASAGNGGTPAGGAGIGGAGGSVLGGGGLGAAGNGAASGAGAGGSPAKSSQGCGSASPLKSGNFNEMVDGTARKFVLDVPSGYEANKPYRLVFVWHPLNGSADSVVSEGYNGLKQASNGGAIFVAPDGLDGSNAEASGRGWWNVNDRDMKFLTAMLARLQAGLCIDQDRIFSTGFSFGGMMSYAVGYEFDVFRAIAPCSGDMQVIPHDATYTRPLPILAFHGNNDTFVTTARGRAARDKYLARNQCGTETQPVAPSPCVEYQGCSAPTTWCEFPGGHNTWSEQPKAIWKFFSEF